MRAELVLLADARRQACAEGSDRKDPIPKSVRKVSGHDNNSFEWLESSLADIPQTARTRFPTATTRNSLSPRTRGSTRFPTAATSNSADTS